MSKDPAPKITVIRPAVQRHGASGQYAAVVYVATFATKEEAEQAAMVLYRASVETFARVGVTPGPAIN
jgi:hypothetical protein